LPPTLIIHRDIGPEAQNHENIKLSKVPANKLASEHQDGDMPKEALREGRLVEILRVEMEGEDNGSENDSQDVDLPSADTETEGTSPLKGSTHDESESESEG
jgi:hypothetical protein